MLHVMPMRARHRARLPPAIGVDPRRCNTAAARALVVRGARRSRGRSDRAPRAAARCHGPHRAPGDLLPAPRFDGRGARAQAVFAYAAYRGLLQLAHEAPASLPSEWSEYSALVRRTFVPAAERSRPADRNLRRR